MVSRVLVIKLGALGDFIQACGPFQAIRRYHTNAPITLLTTSRFSSLARNSGWVDEVWVDDQPPWYQFSDWLALRRRLIEGRFNRVYDLQTSDRSGWYFRQFPRQERPEWSGIVRGCSHPHVNSRRDCMHTIDRQTQQLHMAGIEKVSATNLDWLDGDITDFDLPAQFALLVPGGASGRKEKRWPSSCYAGLAQRLMGCGIEVCLIGDDSEGDLQHSIALAAPGVVELAGKTDFPQIAALARCSQVAVGNDTGPMHIIASCGTPTVVLFGNASNPTLCAPRGAKVSIVEGKPYGPIQSLPVISVWEAVQTVRSVA